MLTLNLLPEQYKVEYNLGKRRRFVMVILAKVCFVLVFFNFLMFAAYVFLKVQHQSLSGALVLQNSADDSKRLSELEKNVSAINSKISRAAAAKSENFNVAVLLEKFSDLLPPGSYFENISIDNVSGQVGVNGFARNREAVIRLSNSLSESDFVVEGTLENPIQNILKSRDIKFVFNFKLKK